MFFILKVIYLIEENYHNKIKRTPYDINKFEPHKKNLFRQNNNINNNNKKAIYE